VLVVGCGAGTPGASSADVPTSVTPAAADAAPSDAAAGVPPSDAAPPDAAPSDAAAAIGWWRSDDVCLELFANGDFELSLMRHEPKVMVMGSGRLTPDGGQGFTLALTPARIWKGRYVSRCRKDVASGDFIAEQEALGLTFKPGAASELKLRRVGATQVELCGQQCATLTRETPALVARWRRAELSYPDHPERAWQAEDLLEIALDRQLGHIWTGFADGKFGTVYGQTEARYVGPDRFTVTFTTERYADVPEGVTPEALGVSFPVGGRQVFEVRRLPGERMELCVERRCATLERQFDSSHYDLD